MIGLTDKTIIFLLYYTISGLLAYVIIFVKEEELYKIYPQLRRNINIFKIYALLLGFAVLPLALILSFLSILKGDK